jgi:hypothetical protein
MVLLRDVGKYWKSYVTEFLAVYKATPHATTELSPVLVPEQYMRTTLYIIIYNLPDVKVDVHTVKEKVQVPQSKYKFHAKKHMKCNQYRVQCSRLG